MLICVFISLFQCTQAEAQLQASEKRLAEILEKEAGDLQEGSSFVHCYSFLQCNTVSNTYVLGVATQGKTLMQLSSYSNLLFWCWFKNKVSAVIFP